MEQNNFTGKNLGQGMPQSLNKAKISTSHIKEQIDEFFENRLSDPDFQESIAMPKEEEASPKESYEALCEIYDDMVKNGSNSQLSKIIGSVLDLSELAKNAGIEFAYEYSDLSKVKKLILIAHHEFAGGKLSEADLKITIEMIARYVEFLAFSLESPDEFITIGLRQKLNGAIRNGNLKVLNF